MGAAAAFVFLMLLLAMVRAGLLQYLAQAAQKRPGIRNKKEKALSVKASGNAEAMMEGPLWKGNV